MILDPRPFMALIARRKAAKDPEFAREYKKGLAVVFAGIVLLTILPTWLVMVLIAGWYLASKIYYRNK